LEKFFLEFFCRQQVSVLDLKQFEFLLLASETPKLSLVLRVAILARARGSLLTNTNININHQTHQRNCKETTVDFRKLINLTVLLRKPFTPFSILITSSSTQHHHFLFCCSCWGMI
jgi:7-cyano-7-deazaguanine synthase in queuosine biosynthesis